MRPNAKSVDVRVLLGKVDFSPDNVVQAAADNSVLFTDAIQYRLDCLYRKAETKMQWEKARAEADLKIRKEARDSGSKITEGNIDALITTDKRLSKIALEHSEAEILDVYSQLVVEAFRMRRDCLRIVEGMTRDEYSMGRAAEVAADKIRSVRQKLRERFPGSQKEED